jgi:hypothetical protein
MEGNVTYILKKQSMKIQTEFICFRMEPVTGFFEHGNEPSVYTKNGEITCGATTDFFRTTLLHGARERVTESLVSHCADPAFSNK